MKRITGRSLERSLRVFATIVYDESIPTEMEFEHCCVETQEARIERESEQPIEGVD